MIIAGVLQGRSKPEVRVGIPWVNLQRGLEVINGFVPVALLSALSAATSFLAWSFLSFSYALAPSVSMSPASSSARSSTLSVNLDDGSYSAIEQIGPVLGWGRTNNNPPINWPDRPHEVDVPIW